MADTTAGSTGVRTPRQLTHYLSTEAGSAGILLAAALIALVWANSPWGATYAELWHTEGIVALGPLHLEMSLQHWVNDGLMVLFFLVLGLEVRRELSMGELTDRRRIAVPLIAAALGIALPAMIFLALNPTGEAARGWGAVIGTDTAFMLGAVALAGPRCPAQLRIFLLTLTVFDDIAAVSVIGVAYADNINFAALAVMGACLVALALLGRAGVWRTWPYGVTVFVLWLATLLSGLHPSVAGMIAGLMIPAHEPTRDDVDSATSLFRAFRQSPLPDSGQQAQRGLQRVVSINERWQVALHPWTSYFIVPVFALANAGVALGGGVLTDALTSRLTWGVVIGLVVGKAAGIGLGVLLATRLRLGDLPEGVGFGQVLGGAAMSGIGFTMSLLIIGLAFDDPVLQTEATVGVLLAAVLAAALGFAIFQIAARVFGQTEASLPYLLSEPVDVTRDHYRGNPDAELTLVEYADFECPFCGDATGMLEDLTERMGVNGRYIFRHLPLTDVHPHAFDAAIAAEAAARQGNFWGMHNLLFAHQDRLERDDLLGYAAELGLDLDRFATDLDDEALADRVRADMQSAHDSGARGTPTFFVGDRRHTGPYDAGRLEAELVRVFGRPERRPGAISTDDMRHRHGPGGSDPGPGAPAAD
ncbi:Na+/H+ antiporter NhaA [Naumannella huperziae]